MYHLSYLAREASLFLSVMIGSIASLPILKRSDKMHKT